ncbi:MAG: NAD-glutamate dehydrogenase [Candidatus Euphemobacter frigidus]|nr:NAD-glutamate dehydrogenase [Candidatus Euphemobacter frigidus]MDP8275217.1 NAD-glutamate dehydrogenase [Candidatus Euphemobacter frigidus]
MSDSSIHKALPALKEIAGRSPLSLKQLEEIESLILARGNFAPERVRKEIAWFCLELGLAEYYFKYTPVEEIARHIESIRATRIISENSGGRLVPIQFVSEHGKSGTYMVEDDYEQIRALKERIESHYPAFRLQSYRGTTYPLRFYLVTRPHFPSLPPSENPLFENVASREFLNNSPKKTIDRYRNLWKRMRGCDIPRITFSDLPKTGETRIMVGMGRDAARGFFTNYTFLLKKHLAHINREYVEPFTDGTVIFSFYLDRRKEKIELERFFQDISMAAILSPGRLAELFYSGDFSAEETMYAVAAANFAHQFLTSYTAEYVTLAGALKDNPEHLGLLSLFKTHLAKDTYHEDRVVGTVLKYREIVRDLFRAFFGQFFPGRDKPGRSNFYLARAQKKMETEISSEISLNILKSLITFNQAILKTNFFKREKVCLSFRLDPAFLNPVDYPRKPCGLFFLIGKGFRGFHIRFREIARGGIRMVRSPSQADYDLNSDFIFDENYNLAVTQQSKNKDIPEGGAKGAILPGRDYMNAQESIFRHYIDGLLDLLLLPHPEIVDYYGKEEILFLGPDEGTAGLMDWAALHARERGYKYWKAFTTGKTPELGGIPHDTYGMTTRGIHQYVKETLRVLGWKEEEITKFQTGGPDGDLGSNEILISRDKTLAVIDGSGVLYDPEGLDRGELKRLARRRRAAEYFNRHKLSPRGFFVGVGERNVKIPDGTIVSNGTDFRNRFHFYPGLIVDLFVPCGGRPRAIEIGNWQEFLTQDGLPRARVIVEGANLFITQEARLRLEDRGVILFKDASANKGGVTSSSLEVLACLALEDGEFKKLMAKPAGKRDPEFRSKYVKEIINTIKRNAADEFKVLWKDHQSSGRPLSVLSDLLDDKINRVTDTIFNSPLYRNKRLREKVIRSYCPEVLVQKIGIKEIMKRVPGDYLRAIFASSLASTYIYEKGLEADELDFLDFVSKT